MEMKWYRLAACAAAFMAGSAIAQSWPTKPIRLLIPIAAGGATDQLARMMALRLSNALGQPVVAENVTGASGSIALQRLAGSEPDGYTLGATACIQSRLTHRNCPTTRSRVSPPSAPTRRSST